MTKVMGIIETLELEVQWWVKRRHFLDLKSCKIFSIQSLNSKPKHKPPWCDDNVEWTPFKNSRCDDNGSIQETQQTIKIHAWVW